ncbi:phenylacetate-CoA oxygenase subunit PaaI [Peribacillus cavernae]|uniref:Phenylacetate-CoA oxygenase subunit PaaI n=1 Tax=Peribacillus cavernae TaxID=1674310 RepID=A0A3S0U613_9BACI|nr:1,2-phenylacetyl-CoA epoxidase subunit PaaC [Peribacillus cavernae]MDQ0218722.1 ring-1,2-phenylacetyl-CoA epoxidase subunit PaaC [Peribacillus cavernae]RUQ30937.1 phenylacetate-CoA oxygenase subunit PaaI [Peribacillus cavernae]
MTENDPINQDYQKAVIELLYQLADDDFIHAFRGSEWLGLAPHIEEDVAFSSISQDTMGHTAMFYRLLEELGEGSADHLAQGRSSIERKNCVLVELVNGPGNYMEKPRYDWAFAVVRNYFYTQAKAIKIQSLKNSSYKPLSDAAVKVKMELYFHLLHWKTWFTQLMTSTDEARKRMEEATERVFAELDGVFSQGSYRVKIVDFGLIEDETILRKLWIQELSPIFQSINLTMPESFGMKHGNGRDGEHTGDLEQAIQTLSEVYRLNPAAAW